MRCHCHALLLVWSPLAVLTFAPTRSRSFVAMPRHFEYRIAIYWEALGDTPEPAPDNSGRPSLDSSRNCRGWGV